MSENKKELNEQELEQMTTGGKYDPFYTAPCGMQVLIDRDVPSPCTRSFCPYPNSYCTLRP